jgi:hypothetical protein
MLVSESDSLDRKMLLANGHLASIHYFHGPQEPLTCLAEHDIVLCQTLSLGHSFV